ncbi:MAG TPA: acetolactate decarboxylase [Chlamydiales bacterium]|nr:acetolactate decarboxylase [Chlamydiales bacterium]
MPKAAILYQAGTITSLLGGVAEGDVDLLHVREHGDFGIGTYNGMDGELVLLDGKFYQIRDEGVVSIPSMSMQTPFVMATFFRSQKIYQLYDISSMKDLRERIEYHFASPNTFYGVRIDGEFKNMKMRCITKQEPPYKPILQNEKNQTQFQVAKAQGTILAFYMPAQLEKINMPGFHMHFISKDLKVGGHIYDFESCTGQVKICRIDRFFYETLNNDMFLNFDMKKNLSPQINEFEAGSASE